MIRYDLTCRCRARFDGWFRSSSDFDAQQTRGLLGCPACGSSGVEKALMAPALGGSSESAERVGAPEAASAEPQAVALLSEKERQLRAMLREIRDKVVATSEDVGERFPDIARRMHAEEIERRSIYGKATPDEARALAEEGVDIHPLPRFPDEGN